MYIQIHLFFIGEMFAFLQDTSYFEDNPVHFTSRSNNSVVRLPLACYWLQKTRGMWVDITCMLWFLHCARNFSFCASILNGNPNEAVHCGALRIDASSGFCLRNTGGPYLMLSFGAASLLRAAVSQCWLLTLLL